MLELAGAKNVREGTLNRAVQVTTEMILQAAPEVVIEVRTVNRLPDIEIEKEIEVWNTLPSLPAVQNQKVVFLTGNDLVIPGPRIVQAITRFALTLHPDAPLPNR